MMSLIVCPNCKRDFYGSNKGEYCPECWRAWGKNDGSFEARELTLKMLVSDNASSADIDNHHKKV